jgi:hypothetical protein
MKTPQQIRNEVEKKDYKEVDKWIEECDVDGRMIEFEFFDSDIEDLKNCVKREKLSILTEYDNSIKEMIENKMSYVKDSPYYHKSTIIVLKELLSKIGDVQQSKEKEEMTREKNKPCLICKKLCYGKVCRNCLKKNKYSGLSRRGK